MKIIEDNQKILKIQKKTLAPFFLGLFGLPFLGMGVMVIFMAQKVILNCQRIEPNQNLCQLTKVSLHQKKTEILSESLIGAKVDINKDSDGDTYRIILTTSTQNIPLTNMYTSGKKNKNINVKKINNFLKDSNQQSLTIIQDERLFLYLFGIIFVFPGGAMVLGGLIAEDLKILFTLTKSTQKFEIKRQKIGQIIEQKYSFSEIDSFAIKTETDSDGDTTYTLQLKLRSGRVEPLYYTVLKSHLEKLAKKMNSFIGEVGRKSK